MKDNELDKLFGISGNKKKSTNSRFDFLPEDHPANWTQLPEASAFKPGTRGYTMRERMRKLISDITGAGDQNLINEALRLSTSTTEDLNTEQLVERAKQIIDISSKS